MEDCPRCEIEVLDVKTFGEAETHKIEFRRCRRKPMEVGEDIKCGFYDWCENCKCRFQCATRRL